MKINENLKKQNIKSTHLKIGFIIFLHLTCLYLQSKLTQTFNNH